MTKMAVFFLNDRKITVNMADFEQNMTKLYMTKYPNLENALIFDGEFRRKNYF